METNLGKIKKIITSYGKCKITFSKVDLDFKFNGKNPSQIKNENFELALKRFYNLVGRQLAEKKFDKTIIEILISEIKIQIEENKKSNNQHLVNYRFDKHRNILSPKCDDTHQLIKSILTIQKSFFQRMLSFLHDIINQIDYIIEDDIKMLINGNSQINDSSFEPPNIGTITVNLNKKDTINLITILEFMELISFTETNRNKFIEAKFKYNNKGVPSFITKMNSDLANLHDSSKDMLPRNQKSMKSLIKNITDKLNDVDFKKYSIWLKNSI